MKLNTAFLLATSMGVSSAFTVQRYVVISLSLSDVQPVLRTLRYGGKEMKLHGWMVCGEWYMRIDCGWNV